MNEIKKSILRGIGASRRNMLQFAIATSRAVLSVAKGVDTSGFENPPCPPILGQQWTGVAKIVVTSLGGRGRGFKSHSG